MGQKNVLHQPVERVEIGAIDPQEVVGLARQGPGADDLGLRPESVRRSPLRLASVWVAMNDLDERLHAKAHALGVKHGARRAYDAAGFQPLTPTRGLAGREVEPLAKRLRGEGRVLLDQGEQATVGFFELRGLVKIWRPACANLASLARYFKKNAHNARRKGRNLTPEQANGNSGDAHGTLPA